MSPDRPIEKVVDHYLEAKLAKEGPRPAPSADDATLIRRLTLDLNGHISTAAEVRLYAESTEPEKRARLVDRLMASPGFARHQADSLEAMLMAGTRGELRAYLGPAFAENRPWDEVFRGLIRGDGPDPGHKGASGFLRAGRRTSTA